MSLKLFFSIFTHTARLATKSDYYTAMLCEKKKVVVSGYRALKRKTVLRFNFLLPLQHHCIIQCIIHCIIQCMAVVHLFHGQVYSFPLLCVSMELIEVD